MIVSDRSPELSPEDEADLVAFVDGRLDEEGRSRVEARAEADAGYRDALVRQQAGRDAVTSAAESTGAPLALKARVEELGAGVVLDPLTATADDIAAAVRRVLEEPSFAAAAARLRDEFRALPSAADTLARITG